MKFPKTRWMLACFASLGLILPWAQAQTPSRPLNVVLITADDLGLQLGCYGDKHARTPRIDRFAAEGARFTTAHVTQSSCSPSRSSLLTGWYPHESGQVGLANRGYSIVGKTENLPALLQAKGYYTGIIGKLHVSPPEMFPFDYHKVAHAPTRTQFTFRKLVDEFLDQPRNRPFFLMLNFFDPHDPFEAQSEGLPENPVTPDDVAPWSFQAGIDSPEIRRRIAEYYSGIHRLDALMGIFLDKLEARGLSQNTMVLFISDNGPPFARAKAADYNLSTHVPLLVQWPGVTQPGMVRAQLVSGVDVFATMLDAAGASFPERTVAKSIQPILRDEKASWRDTVLTTFTAHPANTFYPRRSVTDGKFRLIWNLLAPFDNPLDTIDSDLAPEFSKTPVFDHTLIREIFDRFDRPPVFELYDVRSDPDCLKDLMGISEQEATYLRLKTDLEKWLRLTNDPLLPASGLQTWTRLHRENNSGQWKDPRALYPNR